MFFPPLTFCPWVDLTKGPCFCFQLYWVRVSTICIMLISAQSRFFFRFFYRFWMPFRLSFFFFFLLFAFCSSRYGKFTSYTLLLFLHFALGTWYGMLCLFAPLVRLTHKPNPHRARLDRVCSARSIFDRKKEKTANWVCPRIIICEYSVHTPAIIARKTLRQPRHCLTAP